MNPLTRSLETTFRCLPAHNTFIFFTSGAPATADGNPFDRTSVDQRYRGALFASGSINTVPVGQTFQLEVQLQDSDDGSVWTDHGPAHRSPIYVGDGGTNVPWGFCIDVPLEGSRSFIRTQMTPVFTGPGTGSVFIAPALMLYSSSKFPANE